MYTFVCFVITADFKNYLIIQLIVSAHITVDLSELCHAEFMKHIINILNNSCMGAQHNMYEDHKCFHFQKLHHWLHTLIGDFYFPPTSWTSLDMSLYFITASFTFFKHMKVSYLICQEKETCLYWYIIVTFYMNSLVVGFQCWYMQWNQ